jgi:NitT/TauT family transport system substrate-binding protein
MAGHSFLNNVFKRLNAIWPTLLLLIFVIAATPARAKDQINVVYASISGLFLGCWNAQEAGYFNRENIDVNLVYMQSATTAMQSLLSGDASIILAGGEPVVESTLRGADTIFIAGISVVPAVLFLALPEIRSVADLRGKPVGVTRFGSSTDSGMRQVLRKNGLEPIRDVPILQFVSGHRALAAALVSRQVYAATIAPPNSLRAEKAGAKLLVDLSKEGIYFPYSSIISTRSYLRKNRVAATAFLRAYGDGVKRIGDKSFSMTVLKKYMREQDPEILETTYKYAGDFIVKVPYQRKEGIAEILRSSQSSEARSAKPEDFMDESIVRELEQKGMYR